MASQDWERFGEDIRRTVQEAIDSQDFHKLNQTITDTVNNAADSIARNLQNLGGGGQTRTYNPGGSRAKTHNPNGGYVHVESPRYSGQAQLQSAARKSIPVLYSKTTGVKVGGTVLTAVGFTLGGIFTVIFVIYMVIAVFLQDFLGVYQMAGISIFLIFIIIGYGMGGYGLSLRGRVKRFRSYLQVLGQREYCNIRELADRTHKNIKYVVKDLEKMISGGWFVQGHLDRQKTCLIVSHKVYEQYLEIEKDRQRQELESKEQKTKKEKESESHSGLSPEVRKVIETGDDYIRQIRACNDAIPGVEISNKISRIELVVDRIFDRVEQNPEFVDDIRKLMEYYLPATIKLLKAYEELDSQPVDGENIRSSKAEIEATLDTLSTAFEKLLDNLFQDTAWDVSSDISVLQTMLAQEGLTEDGLRRPF